MKTLKQKLVHLSIIGIFCALYFLVATISMINSVEFFDLAHNGVMNWSLAIGFELGAAASLAAIIILDKTNRAMVWFLFLLLTAFQMMANSYHAFVNLENYMGWIELFGLEDMEVLEQKRILSIVSGAVLPIVALGFIKSLVDYIRPGKTETKTSSSISDIITKQPIDPVIPNEKQVKKVQKEQIERIEEKQKPFGEKLNQLREDQQKRIKEKTPLPIEPETLPVDKPGVIEREEKKEDKAFNEFKKRVDENQAKLKEKQEDLTSKDDDIIVQGNSEVEVKVDGNVTYVTTKTIDGSTAQQGVKNNPRIAQ